MFVTVVVGEDVCNGIRLRAWWRVVVTGMTGVAGGFVSGSGQQENGLSELGFDSEEGPFPFQAFRERTFAAFRHRSFRWVFSGMTVSTVGTWLHQAVVGFLVQEQFHNPTLTGLVSTVQFAPTLVLGLFGGLLADRYNRRDLLRFLLLFELVCSAFLAWALWKDQASLGVFYSVTFLLGAAFALRGPAQFALLPSLVAEQEVSSAISLNSIQFNTGRVIGPFLGGAMLETVGAAATIAVDACTYLCFLLALQFGLTGPKRKKHPRQKGQGGVWEGVRYVWARPWLLGVFLLLAVQGLCAAHIITLLPAYAEGDLGLGPSGFGRLLAAIGIGGVAGAMLSAGVVERVPRHLLGPSVLVANGIVLLGVSAARSLWIVQIMFVFVGVFYIGGRTLLNTAVQMGIVDEMRGRVSALWIVVFTGSFALAAPFWGLLSDRIETSTSYFIGGVACLSFGGLAFTRLSWLERPAR